MLINEKKLIFYLTMLFLLLLVAFPVLPLSSFSGTLPGHLVGILGTLIMGYTLIYPLRKRILGKKGKQNPLKYHIIAGLLGPALVIVHSGHTYASWHGTIAFLSMIVIVLSGLAGRYLLRKINLSIKDQKKGLAEMRKEFMSKKSQIDQQACAMILELEDGLSDTTNGENTYDPNTAGDCDELVELAHAMVETEYILQGISKTKALFGKWLRVHIYLTLFMFAMILVHVMSTIYYGLRWLP